MHIEPHETVEPLEALNAAQAKPRAWRRFRGGVLAARGEPTDRIAEALGTSRRAVQKWVARDNRGGAAALAERPGRGRKPTFPPAQHDRLRARIEAGPSPEDGTCALHGPDVRRILRQEFGVEVRYSYQEPLGLAQVANMMPAGRLVALADGSARRAEDLAPGDTLRLEGGQRGRVDSVGPPTPWGPPPAAPAGRPAPRRVVVAARRVGDAATVLRAGGSTLVTTPGHPFWSADRRAWVPAADLLDGERLLDADGRAVPLQGPPAPRRGPIALYNVEVEGHHTYYAGHAALLAHNGTSCLPADGEDGGNAQKGKEETPDLANHFQGKEKPWKEGATPNSVYTHIDPNTGKANQNAIYDQNGDAIGHVDFKKHGGSSGHGHTFPPAQPSLGHDHRTPPIPLDKLPPGWGRLPPGVEPREPIGP